MFIKLTGKEDNEFYLNMDKIETFSFDKNDGLTNLYFDEIVVEAKETPEEIMQLIKEASK